MEAGILSDATDLHASIRAPRSTVAAICVTLLMCSHFVEAQIAPETENQTVPDQVEAPSPGETIAVQKKQLAGELDAAQKALDRATAEGQDPPPSLQQTVDLLTRIELLLKQQAATVDHKAQLAQLMKEQENSLFELRHPRTADLKAYTFAQLETARDDLSKLAASAQTGAAELKKATENLSRAQDVYKVSESARRQAKERVDLNKDAAKQTDLAFAFIVARLSSRIAREQVDLAEFDLGIYYHVPNEVDPPGLNAEAIFDHEEVAAVCSPVTRPRAACRFGMTCICEMSRWLQGFILKPPNTVSALVPPRIMKVSS